MRIEYTIQRVLLLVAVVPLMHCSGNDKVSGCASGAKPIAGTNSCLTFEHEELSNTQRSAIEVQVTSAMRAVNRLMPVDELLIRIIDDPRLAIPGLGIGGYNPSEQEILLVVDTAFPDLENSLDTYLFPIVAHEAHHAKRRLSVGYGTTLLEAMVSEGLADHFSIQVAGNEPPPWSVAVTGQELQGWTETARGIWHDAEYDFEAWFFGIGDTIPTWTGYSIGYELVDTYLKTHPETTPADLHDEPASSFEF